MFSIFSDYSSLTGDRKFEGNISGLIFSFKNNTSKSYIKCNEYIY